MTQQDIANSLLANVGTAESNDDVAVIDTDNIDNAELIDIHPNVVALANLHASWNAAVLPDGPRSTATASYVEPRPGTPYYSSDSGISFGAQNVEDNDWDAESAANSHNYEDEVESCAALGPNYLNPQRALDLAAYWNKQNPGDRPGTPPVSTRAHYDKEIKVSYWFDPAVRPWVPIDCNYIRENSLVIAAS